MDSPTCPQGYNADGTCFVPWTWDNITPEQYAITPLTHDWPWCAPGQFPSSYDWQAPCGPDPCVTNEFGSYTMWEIKPCTPVRGEAVAVGQPVDVCLDGTTANHTQPCELPETGVGVTVGAFGVFLLIVGIALTRLS